MTTTTETPAAPTVADLLERHLHLHAQIVKHRIIGTVDVDIDEETGRPVIVGYDGWECTGCDWMVGRSASAYVECPDRARLRKEIAAVVAAIEKPDAHAQPAPVEEAA